MNLINSIFKSPANCPTWVRVSEEERQQMIAKGIQAGFTHEQAVELVDASEWMANNKAELIRQHALNVMHGRMIPLKTFQFAVWKAIGKEAYHAIEN